MMVATARLLLGTLVMFSACSSCFAGGARSLSAQQKAAAVKQAPAAVLSFKYLKPTLTSMWIPSIKSDHPSVEVPVVGAPGTPSTTETMSRIQYTVTYTKRPSYVLTGSLTVGTAAFSSTDGTEALPYTLHTPNITISQQGLTKPQQIPAQGIKCSSYSLEPGSSITCSFKAQVFTFLDTPPPGSVRANVQLSGGLQSNKPFKIHTPKTPFEWPAAAPAAGGSAGEGALPANSNMRLSGPEAAQQYLQDTMQSGGASSSSSSSSATVTNYFEPGEGRWLPKGVQGKQPAANTVLEETASFTYTALIPDIPKDICDKPMQVVNSATVEKTSDGLQQSETDISTVDIIPMGCSDDPAAAVVANPAPAAAAAAGPAAPVVQRPDNAPQLLQGAAAAAPAAAPAAAASAAAVAVAAAPAADAVPILTPPGVLLAVAGSRLCGPTSMCGPGQICVDNLFCCDPGSTRCGNGCCPSGHICSGGMCLPPGTVACGATYCPAGLSCLGGRCCGPQMAPCGATCCNWGEICQLGMCLPQGSQVCGGLVCGAYQTCVSPGVCCNTGETVCGATCCGAGMQCLNNQCVAQGSILCAGQICGPGTVCSSGAICCPVGHEFCGGTCCGGGASSCVNGRCLPFGHQVCGAHVCTPEQVCSEGVCCNQGERACAGSCCGNGMTCINGLCVPLGSQPCGAITCQMQMYCADPGRQLCCPHGRRACSGTCCDVGQACNVQGLCMPVDPALGAVVVEGGANYATYQQWGGAHGWGHGGMPGGKLQQGGKGPTVVNNVNVDVANAATVTAT